MGPVPRCRENRLRPAGATERNQTDYPKYHRPTALAAVAY